MKKVALITGGLVMANVAANMGLKALVSSGATISGMANLVGKYLLPAPMFVRRMNR